MATQLQNQGEEVSLLVMLDAYPNHFLPIKEAPDDEEALIALLALGGYDPDSLGEKTLDFEAAIEILRRDGSALASLDETVILNLKNTYVNSVGILGYISRKPSVEMFCFLDQQSFLNGLTRLNLTHGSLILTDRLNKSTSTAVIKIYVSRNLWLKSARFSLSNWKS
nr:hypothetical protein P5626_16560 [Bacillus subtilis]